MKQNIISKNQQKHLMAETVNMLKLQGVDYKITMRIIFKERKKNKVKNTAESRKLLKNKDQRFDREVKYLDMKNIIEMKNSVEKINNRSKSWKT